MGPFVAPVGAIKVLGKSRGSNNDAKNLCHSAARWPSFISRALGEYRAASAPL